MSQISQCTQATCPHTNTHAHMFLVHFFRPLVHCEYFSFPLSLLSIKIAVMHCFRGVSHEGKKPMSFHKKALKALYSQYQIM